MSFQQYEHEIFKPYQLDINWCRIASCTEVVIYHWICPGYTAAALSLDGCHRYGWWMPSGKPIWGCYFKTGSWHIEKGEKKLECFKQYYLCFSSSIFGMILSSNCELLYPNFWRDLVGGQPELQEFSQQFRTFRKSFGSCNEPRWVHNKNRSVFLVGTIYWITDLRNLSLWKTHQKVINLYCGWVRRPINIAPKTRWVQR